MKNLIKAGLVWTGILLSFSARGQIFPLGALPMEHNGSFAGGAGAARLSANSTYSWANYPNVLKMDGHFSSVSYDQFVPAIRSGIGITAGLGGFNLFSTTTHGEDMEGEMSSFSFNIAPKLSANGRHTFSPSVSLSYLKRESEGAVMGSYSLERLDANVGFLWNTPKYYIGYSFNGISNHQYNGMKLGYRFRSVLQAGYTYQKSTDSDFSFTPQLAFLIADVPGEIKDYKSFIHTYLLGYNLNFRYKRVIWGVNNRGIHLGLQTDRLRLMVTNDPGLPQYFNYGMLSAPFKEYTAHLSLRYTFKEKSRMK